MIIIREKNVSQNCKTTPAHRQIFQKLYFKKKFKKYLRSQITSLYL